MPRDSAPITNLPINGAKNIGVSTNARTRDAPLSTRPTFPHNDSLSRSLREQHQAVASLPDAAVFDACVQHGIIPPSPRLPRKALANKVQMESLREQLADFNAFSQFMNSGKLPISLGEGLSPGESAELWVREMKIEVHRKGTGLGENDDGTYQWVFSRDSKGAIRSMMPPDANAMVKNRRMAQWPGKLKRWSHLSFVGRDANTPWSRHRYFDQLKESKEKSSDAKSVECSSTQSLVSTESEDTVVNAISICEEFRRFHRYSVVGEGFTGLQPIPQVKDSVVVDRMHTIRHSMVSFAPGNATERFGEVWMDKETISVVDSLRARREANGEATLKLIDKQSYTARKDSTENKVEKPLPPLPLDSSSDLVTSDANFREFLGVFENLYCTLLRVETIKALRLYCNGDFLGFMELIHQYKNAITLDIRNNLNRGPIFTAAMVGYALEKLVQSSITEYIPYENLKYMRDIMFHYLANRNLHLRHRLEGLKWRPIAFDTRDFNAMNYLDDEYCDGFFKEMQNIIRRGYGNTEQSRWKSGAVVNALLYVSCLTAMDTADQDNAHHAQNLVRSVTVAYMASEALVLAAPIPKTTYIDDYFLKPLLTEVTNKIQNRYSSGALRSALVTTFRDTYVLGALRGERIPGMRILSEEQLAKLPEPERTRREVLLKKRREIGYQYLRLVRMYVEALGETWPNVMPYDRYYYRY